MFRVLSAIFLCLICSFCAASSAEDELSSLLSLDDLTAKDESNAVSAPFEVKCRSVSDTLIECSLVTSDGSYIYKDSLKALSDSAELKIQALPQSTIHSDPNGDHETFEGNISFSIKVLYAKKGAKADILYRGCDSSGICYPEKRETLTLNADVLKPDGIKENSQNGSEVSDKDLFNRADNFLLMLLLCLALGAALDLTPCVFPMLTIYSATIMGGKYSNASHALFNNLSYLTGLALTYCIIGIVFSELGVAAHSVLQHPLCVVLMALMLLVFALDCMGIITIKIPALFNSRLQNTINEAKQGSVKKAFIFGALSALITTPCTSAPLAGALIYVMNTNSLLKGSLLFLFIGLGMGLPLIAVGIFGSRFLSSFKGKGQIVRKVLAIPLVIAAFYVCRHLFSDAAVYVEAVVYGLCAAYLVYVLKDVIKIKYPLTIAALTLFFVSEMTMRLNYTAALPFTNVESVSVLKSHHGEYVFLTVSADWCSNCHELDNKLYSKEEFKKAMEGISLLRYDFTTPNSTQSREMAEKFKLVGVPYAALLDKDQNIIKSYTGAVDFEELKNTVSALK